MSSESMIHRDHDGTRAVYRIRGAFDRAGAWALRDRIQSDPAAEIFLDFSQIRDFSDLAVAVLAHGLTAASRRVAFRGLRQHQLRILRYCGVPVDDRVVGPSLDAVARPVEEPRWSPEAP